MYIFRWKGDFPIAVSPSRGVTEAEVWAWAIEWLRPHTMTDDAEAERFVRSRGEVIEEH